MSSCATAPDPKPEPVEPHEEGRLTTWDDECVDAEGHPEWSRCPKKTLSWIYHFAVDAAHDLAVAKNAIKFVDQRWQLEVDERDAKLDQWFRKWYITIPLGILGGAAVGFGIGFGR